MALPSSGPISMGDINVELQRSRTTANTKLAGGSTPSYDSLVYGFQGYGLNQIAPHRLSEFYGMAYVTYHYWGPMAPFDPCNGYGQQLFWTSVDPTIRFAWSGADANGNYVFIPSYYAYWEYMWVWDMYYINNNSIYYWGVTYSSCGPY